MGSNALLSSKALRYRPALGTDAALPLVNWKDDWKEET